MPAAGSIAAANHLFNIAPKDGTAIGILSQGLILDEILGTPGPSVRGREVQLGRAHLVRRADYFHVAHVEGQDQSPMP